MNYKDNYIQYIESIIVLIRYNVKILTRYKWL
jgi:hypothetical protein